MTRVEITDWIVITRRRASSEFVGSALRVALHNFFFFLIFKRRHKVSTNKECDTYLSMNDSIARVL